MSTHDDGQNGAENPMSETMRELANRRWAGKRQANAAKAALDGGEPHALFPTQLGEPIPQIDWINVTRYEPGRGPVDAPRVFTAAELQSMEDIRVLFGGGVYELKGRAAGPMGGPGPIVRTQRYTLDGDPIPMSGQPQAPMMAQAPAANGGPTDHTALLIAVMQESSKESRAASDRQLQLLMTMMQAQNQQSAQAMQAMAGMMSAAMGAATSQRGPDAASMIGAIAQIMPKPEASNPIEQVRALLDLRDQVAKPAEAPTETIGDVLGGLGQAMGSFAQLEALRIEAAKQGIAPPGAPPPQQPPPQQGPQAPPTQPAPAPDHMHDALDAASRLRT